MNMVGKVLAILGIIICIVIAVIVGAFKFNHYQTQKTAKKIETLQTVLQEGSQTNDFTTSSALYDGGPTTLQRLSYPHQSAQDVRTAMDQRLKTAGYHLTCPGGTGSLDVSDIEHAQEIKPENKCGISGQGVGGDVWFYNVVDSETLVTAFYSF